MLHRVLHKFSLPTHFLKSPFTVTKSVTNISHETAIRITRTHLLDVFKADVDSIECMLIKLLPHFGGPQAVDWQTKLELMHAFNGSIHAVQELLCLLGRRVIENSQPSWEKNSSDCWKNGGDVTILQEYKHTGKLELVKRVQSAVSGRRWYVEAVSKTHVGMQQKWNKWSQILHYKAIQGRGKPMCSRR